MIFSQGVVDNQIVGGASFDGLLIQLPHMRMIRNEEPSEVTSHCKGNSTFDYFHF